MASQNFSFDPSLLDIPYTSNHARSSSRGSVYSAISTVQSTPDTAYTRLSTPPRATPPYFQHGPLLLPKIRSQDQDVDFIAPISIRKRKISRKATTPPAPARIQEHRSSHARSYTNPETLSSMAYAHLASFAPAQHEETFSNTLLCSPASFAPSEEMVQLSSSRASPCNDLNDGAMVDRYGYPTYHQLPFAATPTPKSQSRIQHQPSQQRQQDFIFPSSFAPRAHSPLSVTATPEPTPSTTLANYLTCSNPAASLVQTAGFHPRDPNARSFWWDIRNIKSWSSFTSSSILALPGAAALLQTPVPAPVLPQPNFPSRHPETEQALHSIYAGYYLPKLNAALQLSSPRPVQLSVPSTKSVKTSGISDLLFVANIAGEAATAAAMFGGKPTARVVGIVRSFDRFNTGMRVEGNIKRVEYLRGLSALHHCMREHGTRYGFILTEIELVLVRIGTEPTPFFGNLEVTSVRLATAAPHGGDLTNPLDVDNDEMPLTACLALWGLCQMASEEALAGYPAWKAEIGAPAEGTRRKAKPRDSWMPQPQLAEKREAKRSRGWVWPEDAIGRKELGKRGVKYGGI